MIGRIQGQLQECVDSIALLNVCGVGYEVELTRTARANLGQMGDEVAFYTHFVVREDAQTLYGFATRDERDLFRDLIRINGVGPKVALGLLGHLSIGALVQAVLTKDLKALSSAPGIGKKTAERLLMELKDRLPDAHSIGAEDPGVGRPSPVLGGSALKEAEAALVGLGYRPQEAARVLAAVAVEGASAEGLVKSALQHIARSGDASDEIRVSA